MGSLGIIIWYVTVSISYEFFFNDFAILIDLVWSQHIVILVDKNNIGSGNDFVPSDNKPLPQEMLAQICDVTMPRWFEIWQGQALSNGLWWFLPFL